MIRLRPMWGLLISSLIAIIILMALGTWQMQRLAWKQDVLTTLHQRMTAAPQSLGPTVMTARNGADVRFQRVELSGQFLGEKPRHMHMVRDGVVGAQILAPFLDRSAHVVFVDLGFTPHPDTVQIPAVPRRFIARVRPNEPRGMKPDNNPAANQWYWRDLATLNQPYGPVSVPFVLEAETALVSGVTPTPVGPGIITNRHLDYALTWYSFAVIVLIMVLAVHLKLGRFSRA